MSTNNGDSKDLPEQDHGGDSVVPAVVRELIEESQKIQEWIGKLVEHADEAYPEVFERVRSDYAGRLDGVADQLKQHRSDLLVSLEGRKSAVAELRTDRGSHAADLEEVRLRHAVGELSEGQWESRRKKIESALGDVDSHLTLEEAAVSELTSAVDTIDERVRPVPRVSPTASQRAAAAAEAGDAEDAGERTPTLRDTLRPEPPEGVAEPPERVAAAAPSWSKVISETPDDGEEGDDAGDASDDELAFLETVSANDVKRLDPIAAALLDDE